MNTPVDTTWFCNSILTNLVNDLPVYRTSLITCPIIGKKNKQMFRFEKLKSFLARLYDKQSIITSVIYGAPHTCFYLFTNCQLPNFNMGRGLNS